MVGIGIMIVTILGILVFTPACIETLARVRNPLPKMSGANEEKRIFGNIIKTREMFETMEK